MTAPTTIRFDSYVLDAARGILSHPEGRATLRPKTTELLLFLLRHAGRPVSRAEILDAVWPGIFVTDDGVTQCVGEIRRALGPAGEGLLQTLPRRGYLFEVAPEEDAETAPPPRSGIAFGAGIPVVAVMPLRLVQSDEALAVFADGLLYGVIGTLAALREPVVISADSTTRLARLDMDASSIAERLGAGYVASGAVRRAGNGVRLAMELSDGARGSVLWQRTFDVSEDALFDAGEDLATGIAHALVPQVREAELRAARRMRPADLGAYHLLLEARRTMARLDRESFDAGGVLLRRAIERDPLFAATHATLADWYSLRIGQGWSPDPEADERALDTALLTALDLDGNDPRALAILGHNRTILQRDYDGALRLFKRALDAAPNSPDAWLWSAPTHAFLGDAREAVRRAERALKLSPDDPLLFRFESFLAIGHYAAGDYEAAATLGLRSAHANPHYTNNLRLTAAALAAFGRTEEARPLARRVVEMEPGFSVGALIARHAFRDDRARERYGRHLIEAGLPP